MINISSVNVYEVQRTDSRCCAWTHLPPIAHKDAHAKNHIKTIAWTYWIMTFCFEFHFCWSLYFSCKSFSRPVCLYVYVKVLSSDLDLYLHGLLVWFIFYSPTSYSFLPLVSMFVFLCEVLFYVSVLFSCLIQSIADMMIIFVQLGAFTVIHSDQKNPSFWHF